MARFLSSNPSELYTALILSISLVLHGLEQNTRQAVEVCDAYLTVASFLSQITQIQLLPRMSAKGKEKQTATATNRINGTSLPKDNALKPVYTIPPSMMQPNPNPTVQRTASFVSARLLGESVNT